MSPSFASISSSLFSALIAMSCVMLGTNGLCLPLTVLVILSAAINLEIAVIVYTKAIKEVSR